MVFLAATTIMALLTSMVFVQGTSSTTHLVASQAYNDDVIEVRVIITLPQTLYEEVSSPSECEILLSFPEGPMNVTVESVEIALYAESGRSVSELYSFRTAFSPHLAFENVQDVILQQEMSIRPRGSSVSTQMACYLDMEVENSTGAYGLLGGPTGIESVPVTGWLLHPVVWVVLSVASWSVFALILAWKRIAP